MQLTPTRPGLWPNLCVPTRASSCFRGNIFATMSLQYKHRSVASDQRLKNTRTDYSELEAPKAQYINQDSKILAPFACFPELLVVFYGSFWQRKMHHALVYCPDEPGGNQSYFLEFDSLMARLGRYRGQYAFFFAKTTRKNYQQFGKQGSTGHQIRSGSPKNFQNRDCPETRRLSSQTPDC